jgi:hypothetical protein
VSVDAKRKPAADVLLVSGGRSRVLRGSKQMFRPFFHVSSHAVAGRLACLIVVAAPVIFNVTPPPE